MSFNFSNLFSNPKSTANSSKTPTTAGTASGDKKTESTEPAKKGLSLSGAIANPFSKGKDTSTSKSTSVFGSSFGSGIGGGGNPFDPNGSDIEKFLSSKMAKGTGSKSKSDSGSTGDKESQNRDNDFDQKMKYNTNMENVKIQGVHFELLFEYNGCDERQI